MQFNLEHFYDKKKDNIPENAKSRHQKKFQKFRRNIQVGEVGCDILEESEKKKPKRTEEKRVYGVEK